MNKYLIACIAITAFWIFLWTFIGSQASGPVNVEGLLQVSAIYLGTSYGIVVAIYFIRKRKSGNVKSEIYTTSKPQQPPKQQQDADETQFWVCPNCGQDTQMKAGRQYCSSCKIYLSI